MDGENIQPAEKSEKIDEDLSLEKLLKLSKSFKIGVDKDLDIFKKEIMTMINEAFGMNSHTTPNEESYEIINNFKEQSHDKYEADFNDLFRRQNSETFGNLEQALLKNEHDSLDVQLDAKKFQSCQRKKKSHVNESSVQNISSEESHKMSNFDQANDEKLKYIKRTIEIENKGRYWMNKYDDLFEKYLQLESKCVQVEKENCGYQMEIARIKIIEEENLRLNQAIDKSNLVNRQIESALESCLEEVDKYKNEVDIARNKVKESIEMVEKTCSEKDRLETDLNRSKDEISRLENELKRVVQEAGEKVYSEVEKVKSTYNNKLSEANVKIEDLLSEKQIACNKTQLLSKEYDILNEKYTLINQKYADEPEKNSKKVSLLVQQINEYEVTMNNITGNVEILKEANRRLQDSYARKKIKYIMEITFLKDTKKSLENNLNKAMVEIAEHHENIVKATDRIQSLELENNKLKRPEDNSKQKNMQIKELTKHLEALKQILDMWKIEMQNIIVGFQHRVKQLTQYSNKLYKLNVKMKRRLTNLKMNYLNSKRKKMHRPYKNQKQNISSVSTST